MAPTLHHLRHELRRLAPWIGLHATVLIVGAVTLDHHDLAKPRPTLFLVLDLALIGLIALLISDLPMFGRHAFLKTRPFQTQELFSSRLLFLALALWLPRVGAQLLALHGLGLLSDPVAKFLIADVALRQALWIGTLLAALSLCWRQWHWVVAAPVFAILGSGALTFEPQPVLTLSSWELRLSQLGAFAVLVAIVLVVLYRVRFWSPILALIVGVVVVELLVPNAPADPAKSIEPVVTPSSLGFEIRRAPQPIHPLGPTDAVLAVGLEPSEIDPALGLRIRRVSSVLTSPRGLSYRGTFENPPHGCRYSEAWLRERVLETTPPRPDRCGATLQVPLFEIRPDWVELLDHLEGRLEVELEVEVFRQQTSATGVRAAGALGSGLDRLVVQAGEANPEDGLQPQSRIDLLRFTTEASVSPLATTTPGLDLLDTQRGRLVEFEEQLRLHDRTANLVFRQPGLQLQTIEISIDETTFAGPSPPRDGSSLELLLSDFGERSEVFSVTLKLDDFRAGDFVGNSFPHRSRSQQEYQP